MLAFSALRFYTCALAFAYGARIVIFAYGIVICACASCTSGAQVQLQLRAALLLPVEAPLPEGGPLGRSFVSHATEGGRPGRSFGAASRRRCRFYFSYVQADLFLTYLSINFACRGRCRLRAREFIVILSET